MGANKVWILNVGDLKPAEKKLNTLPIWLKTYGQHQIQKYLQYMSRTQNVILI